MCIRDSSYTEPHLVEDLVLGEREDRLLTLPQSLADQNLVVEARGAGQRRVAMLYAHSLDLRLKERFGQLQLLHAEGAPLAGAYVKVYGRQGSGAAPFYKDGYTDLRGRFDYATLSTNQLDGVERFAILVVSKEHGALVREAAPPPR